MPVLYDGDCGICTRTAQLLRRLDRRRRLRPMDFEEAKRSGLAIPLSDAELHANFHVVDGGRVLSGASAIPLVLERLPLGSLPARWIRSSPLLRGFVGRSYRWINRNRYRFGGLGCVPPRSTDTEGHVH